jgi:hypothetical protein
VLDGSGRLRFLGLACQGSGTTVIGSLVSLVGRFGSLQDLGENNPSLISWTGCCLTKFFAFVI